MEKQNVVYAYNGLLSSLKKERNPDIHYKMVEPEDIMLNEIIQSQKNIVLFHLYEVLRVMKIIKTESIMIVAKGWGRMESYCLTGIEFQFYNVKRIMGMDGGDGRTKMCMFLLHSIKMVMMINFMCILTINFKNQDRNKIHILAKTKVMM